MSNYFSGRRHSSVTDVIITAGAAQKGGVVVQVVHKGSRGKPMRHCVKHKKLCKIPALDALLRSKSARRSCVLASSERREPLP